MVAVDDGTDVGTVVGDAWLVVGSGVEYTVVDVGADDGIVVG
jgi:hypothetical protein